MAPTRHPMTAELEKARDIVRRHPLPSHVSGVDVRFGDFDGDPVMWVVFHAVDTAEPLDLERNRKVVAALRDELLEAFEHRYPLFSYDAARPAVTAGT